MESLDAHPEKSRQGEKEYLREMVFLAEQAKEGQLKVLPGKAWGKHFPVPADERKKILQGVLQGKIKPEDAETSITPDALVYDVSDLGKEGLDGVSSKIFDESSTIKYYDYPRFAKFLAQMKGSSVSVEECEQLYEGITKVRTQKKLRDAYGSTGQRQLDSVLERDAKSIAQNIGKLPPTEKVLQALKLDWLCEDRGVVGTLERDAVISKLSGSEREMFKKLAPFYKRYVEEGDEKDYTKLTEGIRDTFERVQETTKQKEAPSESMRELDKELEKYKDETGMPGTPEDPGIPPEDSDEYHTPEGGMPPQESGSKEKNEPKPIFEIAPPLGGYYAGGRKSYYDRARKTWSKKKRLTEYKAGLTTSERHTFSGKTDRGIKSLAIPNSFALDAGSIKYTGAKPELFRDQNGCFYIQTDGPSSFSVEFGKEGTLFTGPVVPEDTEEMYDGALSPESEALLGKLSGNPIHIAEQVRQYIWANHFYPGGGDLSAAQAVQAKLRHESSAGNYLQNIDKSEYLECYSSNTLFVAMLRKAGIPARLVIGHKVEGAHKGKSAITNSTGHAWSEVFDGSKWVRFDATPAPKPEDKKKKDKGDDKKNENAPEADDNGKDATQKSEAEGQEGENSTKQDEVKESSDSDVKDGEKSVEESKQKIEKAEKEKEKFEEKLEKENSFKDLEEIKKEMDKSELLPDMKKELEEKIDAKEEEMKESIKEELDKMVEDGFLDEEKREKLEKLLEENSPEELDRLQKKIEEENSLYNQYEEIREEIAPLVEKWFEYFVERLPREQNVDVDEDSLSRQGVFNRRSVNKARNLLFGSIKNPRVIRSSVKPLFMASILVDVSGSMESNNKLRNARKLLVFYSELFSKISEAFGYIRFSINTFSDSVHEIKGYDQDYNANTTYPFSDGSRSTVKFRLMDKLRSGGGTNMLDSIKKAASDLNRETYDFPDYASAFYFVGDGEDTQGNSGKVKDFLEVNERERGFGDHMRSAIMLGTSAEKNTLAKIFGEEHTTVAPDFDTLIEESMLRFNDDIEAYLSSKTG